MEERDSFHHHGVSWSALEIGLNDLLNDVGCSNEKRESWRERLKFALNPAVENHGEVWFSRNKLTKGLVKLAQEDVFAEAIRAGWGLRFLLKMLQLANPHIQILCCLMLSKGAKFSSEEYLKAAVPPLIEMLNFEWSSRGISLKEVSAFALKRLAEKGEDLRLFMGSAGALPVLLNMTSHCDGRAQISALQALKELVLSTKRNQRLLAQTGGLQVVLELLNSSSVIVKCLSAEIIGALAGLREIRRAIANRSGISCLVEAVKVGCMASKTRAAHALGLLAFTKRLRRMIVDSGGISVLTGLLRDGDQTAKLVAGNSLGIISAHVDHLWQVRQAGAISHFVSLLEEGSPYGKDIAEDAFCILAVSEENALAIMEHLVGILRNGNVKAKAAAADIIWDLSGYRHSVSVILVSGAIPLLVGLLKDENDEVRENVSGAIAQLTSNDDDRQALADSGVIPILVELLQDQSNEVKGNVLQALHNFAEDSYYRFDLVNACAIPALLAQQNNLSAGSMVSEHAAATLQSLGHGI